MLKVWREDVPVCPSRVCFVSPGLDWTLYQLSNTMSSFIGGGDSSCSNQTIHPFGTADIATFFVAHSSSCCLVLCTRPQTLPPCVMSILTLLSLPNLPNSNLIRFPMICSNRHVCPCVCVTNGKMDRWLNHQACDYQLLSEDWGFSFISETTFGWTTWQFERH